MITTPFTDLGAMPKDFQYREIVKGEQMEIEQIVKLLASNTRDAGMDWIQVRLNGGPPCFQLMPDGYLCGRAQRWEGHPEMHEYVSLRDLLAALLTDRDSLQQALKQCGEALMRASAWVESSPLRAHCNAVLDIPLVREAMTQQEKAATDSGDSFRSRNAAKSDPDAGGK